jgi:hypothetical protein
MKNTFSNRDKAILIGLYLSKFDEEALEELGFQGFQEAFNAIGYSIGVKPASLKNYRDEFDPYFPNQRKGWHKRSMRECCKVFYDKFSSLKLTVFTELVKSYLIQDYEIEKIVERIEKKDKSESVAKRLITGKAAEEYFEMNYKSVSNFSNFELKNTTNLACGFDFKLSKKKEFYCVEVKGLNANSGSVALTEKEFYVAKGLKNQYCLFVVMNFIEKPTHKLFFDPLNSKLIFKKFNSLVTQINYITSI